MQCVLQCVLPCVLQLMLCCSALEPVCDGYQVLCCTAHCNTLQHTATYCNTLQHTATHCNSYSYTHIHIHTRVYLLSSPLIRPQNTELLSKLPLIRRSTYMAKLVWSNSQQNPSWLWGATTTKVLESFLIPLFPQMTCERLIPAKSPCLPIHNHLCIHFKCPNPLWIHLKCVYTCVIYVHV